MNDLADKSVTLTKENTALKKRIEELTGLIEKSKDSKLLQIQTVEIKKLRQEMDIANEEKIQIASLKASIHTMLSSQEEETKNLKFQIKSLSDQMKEGGLLPKKLLNNEFTETNPEEISNVQKAILQESEIQSLKEASKKWIIERNTIRIEMDDIKSQNIELKSHIESMKGSDPRSSFSSMGVGDMKNAAKGWWSKAVDKTATLTVPLYGDNPVPKSPSMDVDVTSVMEAQIKKLEKEIIDLKDQTASQDGIVSAQSTLISTLQEKINSSLKAESMKKNTLPILPKFDQDQIQKLENEILGLKNILSSQDNVIKERDTNIISNLLEIDQYVKEGAAREGSFTEQIQKLENEILGMKIQVSSQDDAIKARDSKISSIQKELENYVKDEATRKDSLDSTVQSLQNEVLELRNQKKTNDLTFKELENEAHELRSRNASQNAIIVEKDEKYDFLNHENESNVKINAILQSKIQEMESEFTKITSDKANLSKSLGEEQQAVQTLENKFQKAKEDIIQMEKGHIKKMFDLQEDTTEKLQQSLLNENQLKKDLEILREQYYEKDKAFDEKNEEVESLRMNIQKLESVNVERFLNKNNNESGVVLDLNGADILETRRFSNHIISAEEGVMLKDVHIELGIKYNALIQEHETSNQNFKRVEGEMKTFTVKIAELEALRDSNNKLKDEVESANDTIKNQAETINGLKLELERHGSEGLGKDHGSERSFTNNRISESLRSAEQAITTEESVMLKNMYIELGQKYNNLVLEYDSAKKSFSVKTGDLEANLKLIGTLKEDIVKSKEISLQQTETIKLLTVDIEKQRSEYALKMKEFDYKMDDINNKKHQIIEGLNLNIAKLENDLKMLKNSTSSKELEKTEYSAMKAALSELQQKYSVIYQEKKEEAANNKTIEYSNTIKRHHIEKEELEKQIKLDEISIIKYQTKIKELQSTQPPMSSSSTPSTLSDLRSIKKENESLKKRALYFEQELKKQTFTSFNYGFGKIAIFKSQYEDDRNSAIQNDEQD